MKLFTIGFTKKSAEEFFVRLKEAGVRRVVDVRLNNTSQIAGFAKARDLEFFLRAIAGIDYLHLPDLAPTQDILDDFVKAKGAWSEYTRRFTALMEMRQIAETLHERLREGDCLLCSEDTPEHCHRRLVAEHFQEHWPGVLVYGATRDAAIAQAKALEIAEFCASCKRCFRSVPTSWRRKMLRLYIPANGPVPG